MHCLQLVDAWALDAKLKCFPHLFSARKNLSDLLSTDDKTTVSRRSSGVSSFGGTDLDKERGEACRNASSFKSTGIFEKVHNILI